MSAPDPGRITQRDLARLARVSHTTVSLALRGHPSIPPATREHILRLAEKQRYRPDPALAALNAYRIDRATPRFHGTLAWLTGFATADGWRGMIQAEGYFEGARERAERLGYRLEDIWAAQPSLTARRLTQILLTRGVRGIVVAPLPRAHGEIPLEWRHFSAAALGYSLARPALHVVMNHQFRNMKHLVAQLAASGYRRIGLAIPAANDERVDHNYLSGYWIAQQSLSARSGRPQPLLAEPFERRGFLAWFRRQRPDAIIVAASYARQVISWLEETGRRVPADIGVAVAATPFGDPAISGIDEHVRMVGAMAVDTVVGMIHRNEVGVPEHPWRILAEGSWHQGRTVRAPAPGN